MCWIAVIPGGMEVKEEYFRKAFSNNLDGAGHCYVRDGEIVTEKGFFKFEDWYESYNEVSKDIIRVVHFRASTGGKKDDENCHPFLVNRYIAFAHNGVFNEIQQSAEHSDTWHFNEEILKPFFNGGYKKIYSSGMQFMLKEAIGSGNKLVFLTIEGKAVIINAKAGFWRDGENVTEVEGKGIWFSNTMHTYQRYRQGGYCGGPYGQTKKTNSEITNGTFDWDDENIVDAEIIYDDIDLEAEGMEYTEWVKKSYAEYLNNVMSEDNVNSIFSEEEKEEEISLVEYLRSVEQDRLDAISD